MNHFLLPSNATEKCPSLRQSSRTTYMRSICFNLKRRSVRIRSQVMNWIAAPYPLTLLKLAMTAAGGQLTGKGSITILLSLLLFPFTSLAGELTLEQGTLDYGGNIEFQGQSFTRSALSAEQEGITNFSAALQPEFTYKPKEGNSKMRAVFFGRIDQQDDNRTHADIREFLFQTEGKDGTFSFQAGIGQVFWGVTEARHVVDIINQKDLVEGPLSESKLGQPMANLTWYLNDHTFDFYVLPFFRERTFPSREGRLRTTPYPDTNQKAIYDSAAGRDQVSYAVRASTKALDNTDIALSHFYGTSREPVYSLGATAGGNLVFVPNYHLIHQTGLELQYAHGNTLYKFEGFYRTGEGNPFIALDTGIEHTLVGAFGTKADIGLLAEYLYESRDSGRDDAFFLFNPMQNDIMIGARLAFNDAKDSQALLTLTTDMEEGGNVVTLELSRRVGENWKLSAEGMLFHHIATPDPLYTLRKDSFMQLNMTYYF